MADEKLFDQNLNNNYGLGDDVKAVIPDPMGNMIPVTLKSVEFERHVEEISNIGRFSLHNVETNCILTIVEDKFVIRSGENDPDEEHTIMGRSITHDPDDIEEVQKEKAYNDALNKLHMLGFKIKNVAFAVVLEDDKEEEVNMFTEAEQPEFDPIGSRPNPFMIGNDGKIYPEVEEEEEEEEEEETPTPEQNEAGGGEQ